jgi:hypothetical protein
MADEENAEVRLKLIADDGTSETTARMQTSMAALSATVDKLNASMHEMHVQASGGMKEAGDKTAHAKAETENLWQEVMKGNAAWDIAKEGAKLFGEIVKEGVLSMKELNDMALEAAVAEAQQVKVMSGVLSMVDGAGNSMENIKAYAADLHEELDKMGREAGVSTDAINEAFMMVEERTTLSSEKVKDLVGDMAEVGKVTRGGLQGLSQGFMMMEMGMVKAKNPVVQLVAATHLLKGNAHAVAAQMQKMSPAEQMKLGEEAITKMSEKLKQGGSKLMDMGMLKASFAGTKEMFFETMGKPMLDKLLPPLNQLKDFLASNEEALTAFADKVGQTMGQVIEFLENVTKGIYQGLVENWDGIRAAYDEIFGDWQAAWSYASTSTDGVQTTFKDITKSLIEAFVEISRYLKAAAEVAMDANDLVHGRTAGTTQMQIQDKSMLEKGQNVSSPKSSVEFDEAARKYRALALDAGASAAEVDDYIVRVRQMHDENMQGAENAKAALGSGNYQAFNEYIGLAIKNNSDGATQYALSLVAASKDAQQALMSGAIHIEGGMDALMQVIKEKSPELARTLANVNNPIKSQGGIKPAGSVVNFNGGQTFHIKQDFKNEDPDRIAFVFRRDVVKSAEARRQSRMGSPFGL